jgi:hypothetical protein
MGRTAIQRDDIRCRLPVRCRSVCVQPPAARDKQQLLHTLNAHRRNDEVVHVAKRYRSRSRIPLVLHSPQLAVICGDDAVNTEVAIPHTVPSRPDFEAFNRRDLTFADPGLSRTAGHIR